MQLTAKTQAIWIKKYRKEAVSAFSIGWTSFHWDFLPKSEYIILDAFYTAGIVLLEATQFQKMSTLLQKCVFMDYFNDDWYIDVYHHYTNQHLSPVDWVCYVVTKKQAEYY